MMNTKVTNPAMDAAMLHEALGKVLASPGFEGGGRLCEFLAYVIEEELGGRGEAIRGKTIAQDVYGRTPQDKGDPENVVRVDARRLRQQLDHYYETTGAQDPVRIHLDTGSYRPRVEVISEAQVAFPRQVTRQAAIYVGLFVLGTLVGVGLTSFHGGDVVNLATPTRTAETSSGETGPSDTQTAQRAAIMGKSPASLEAMNLAKQAETMIFPIFDVPRQELLTSVFEQVVELDHDYFEGHAGLAHVLSIRSILSSDQEIRVALLERARASSAEAVRLNPANPWTQSALAWVALAGRDYADAMRLAELAVELAPEDPQMLDFLGTMALFSGEFDRAIEAADGGKPRVGSTQRFANRNIFAAASFHVGNYRDSYEAFEKAAEFGDPLSAPSLAYQAAALAAVGREKEATRKLEELARAWPDAQLEAMLYNIHRDAAHADDVLDKLRSLGWVSNAKKQDPKH